MTDFPPRRFRRRVVLGLPALAAAAVTVAANPAVAAAAPAAAKPECVADLITAEPSLARGA
ncbi:hypothetical protein Ais01nite_56340 [Asanoa ishikariensis]|uniref:Uncharacterized protein n=1 Tax=Asanoa ishikariensis TaxID=137265 RepID=A0A1H3TZ24_9ACTN|nr:hypothetical protein [Asanoa ishikariensis]GIF67599.1 hypothetical protein Ais01nite_56340 [Asanoa ishikariensis]SDZ54509.1 hypothetical protein SAMN05421684_6496 [Asanoa ishikariensis]